MRSHNTLLEQPHKFKRLWINTVDHTEHNSLQANHYQNMCGIAGIIGARSSTLGAGIRRMTKHLKHRGPNDHGEFSDDWLAVGHRRLSILDLTAEGRQPIWSEDGRYAIVYNGEVYNFAALRARL